MRMSNMSPSGSMVEHLVEAHLTLVNPTKHPHQRTGSRSAPVLLDQIVANLAVPDAGEPRKIRHRHTDHTIDWVFVHLTSLWLPKRCQYP